MTLDIEPEIRDLEGLNLGRLRTKWKSLFDRDPPPCRSTDILRRLLATRIQEQAFGGLLPDTQSKIKKLSRAISRNGRHLLPSTLTLKPGIVLTREWQGVIHKVHVLKEGFEYEGSHFKSLSEVARRITGTRWSGPLFFGLRK